MLYDATAETVLFLNAPASVTGLPESRTAGNVTRLTHAAADRQVRRHTQPPPWAAVQQQKVQERGRVADVVRGMVPSPRRPPPATAAAAPAMRIDGRGRTSGCGAASGKRRGVASTRKRQRPRPLSHPIRHAAPRGRIDRKESNRPATGEIEVPKGLLSRWLTPHNVAGSDQRKTHSAWK